MNKNETEKCPVCLDKISKLVDGDSEYIKKFCKAGILSFTQFKDNYIKSMNSKDLKLLKKEGHRIKPVAELLECQPFLKEYENAKKLLRGRSTQKEIQVSVNNMSEICDEIINIFHHQTANK